MTETITLGGKRFSGVTHSLPANQDEYIMAHLRRCGAMDVLLGHDGKGERTQEKRAEDLLTCIMLAGETSAVLAGCLTEDGKKWTRAAAIENTAAFDAITDPDEKLAMRASIVNFVIGFFRLGEPAAVGSPKSSSQSAKVPRSKSAAHGTSETSRT